MTKVDYKKEFKQFYMPKTVPELVYLSDLRRTKMEQLKTVLRFHVEKS